jgi:D-alanine-D-alanine ligase
VERYPCRSDLPVLLIYNLDLTWPEEDIQNSLDETRLLVNGLREAGHTVQELCIQNQALEQALSDFSPADYIVFNWCEELPGIPRSAYQVTQILERLGYSFTGADTQGLILSQDKRQVKRLLRQHGIPTPNWKVTETARQAHWERYPAIVKPAFEHCSVGISRQSVVQSDQELEQRIQAVLEELGEPVIVEDFLDGREFHIGVVGNGDLTVLPPAEIIYTNSMDIHDRLCTYEANFDKHSLAYQHTIPRLPVELSQAELHLLEETVAAAYRVTACRDYARLDVRLQDGVFYILDVNHNADISSDNSLVKAAELLGLSHGGLGSWLVNLAAERHPSWGAQPRQKEERA